MNDWYRDWQSQAHVVMYDGRSRLGRRDLIRNYEAFNDVRLLKEHLDPARSVTLLEVGCATGEFSRYVQCIRPAVRYYGVDYEWGEYVLHNPLKGFRWLIESDGHWTFYETLTEPPLETGS